jgi:hypothetical protein
MSIHVKKERMKNEAKGSERTSNVLLLWSGFFWRSSLLDTLGELCFSFVG